MIQDIIFQLAYKIGIVIATIAILSGIKHSLVRQAIGALKHLLNVLIYALAVVTGIVTGVSAAPYKPVVDLSGPQLIKPVPAGVQVSSGIPSNAIPSNAIPSNAIPSNAIPSNALPSNAIPSNAIPSNAIPSNFTFKTMRVSPPDFGEVVCKGTCPKDSKYTYYSDQAGVEVAGPAPADVKAEIWSDAYTLTKGDCTIVYWQVSGADQVFFQGQQTSPIGSQQVCPQETTSYNVNASNSGGNRGGAVLAIRVEEPQMETGAEQAPAPDRCSYFEGVTMKVVYLDWLSGAPLEFYIKMEGGVPGLEIEIPDELGKWEYMVTIGDVTSDDCDFIQGYKERLYCSIDLPKGYSSSMQPMTLTVNNCEKNVYQNQTTFLPALEGGGSNGDDGSEDGGGTGGGVVCGPEPADSGSPDWSDWCSCRHDNGLGC